MDLSQEAADEPVLSSAAAEILATVPLIEPYFRRGNVHMPEPLAAVFAESGLTARHGGVIAQLASAGELSVGDLARRLGVSLPTASGLVADLDRAGVVVRREDPANRRRTLVAIADAHTGHVRELVAGRAEPLLKVLERLSPGEREGFAKGLRTWAEQVRDW